MIKSPTDNWAGAVTAAALRIRACTLARSSEKANGLIKSSFGADNGIPIFILLNVSRENYLKIIPRLSFGNVIAFIDNPSKRHSLVN
jgi:hypothetical protein